MRLRLNLSKAPARENQVKPLVLKYEPSTEAATRIFSGTWSISATSVPKNANDISGLYDQQAEKDRKSGMIMLKYKF